MTQCLACGEQIAPIETYGDYDCPMCWDCFWELSYDPWNIQLYTRETDEHGVTHLRKGPDFDWFFAEEEKSV